MGLPNKSTLINICFMEAFKHNSMLIKGTGEVVSGNNFQATVVFRDTIGSTNAVKWNMGNVTYLG